LKAGTSSDNYAIGKTKMVFQHNFNSKHLELTSGTGRSWVGENWWFQTEVHILRFFKRSFMLMYVRRG